MWGGFGVVAMVERWVVALDLWRVVTSVVSMVALSVVWKVASMVGCWVACSAV